MIRTRDGTPPAVVAIVLNWRQADRTIACLHDLLACDYPRLTVLAMDNGSGDDSPARIAAACPGATLVLLPENVGYCAAINQGIARARALGAPYVLFVNNDTRLPREFLTPLVEALEADPTAAGAGSLILRPDGRVWCAGGSARFGPNLVGLRGFGRRDRGQFRYPEPVEFLTGACVLYRLDDLQAVGDVSEDYFMYIEDADLGRKLARRGRRLLLIPWSRIEHDASASTGGGLSPRRKYMSAANSLRYLTRHGRPREWLAFVICDLLAWPFLVILTAVMGRSLRPLLAKGRGLLRAFSGRPLTPADVES